MAASGIPKRVFIVFLSVFVPAAGLVPAQPSAGPGGVMPCGALSFGTCASQSCDYCADGPTELNAVAVSSDGSRVVSGGSRGSIVLFDGGTGEIAWDDSALCSEVRSVAISSDGSWFAAGTDCRVYLFHESSATPVLSYNAGDRVNSVALSSDGQYLAAGSENGKILRFRAGSSTPVFTCAAGGAVNSVAITPDGDYIAAGSDDALVRLFQTSCATPRTFEADGGVLDVAVADDGSYVAGGDGEGIVYLWDSSGARAWSYGTDACIYTLTLSSPAGRLVASNEAETVYCLDASTGSLLWERDLDGGGDVSYAAISSDGARVAAACEGNVQILDASSGARLCGFQDRDLYGYGAATSADGATAAFLDGEENTLCCLASSNTPLWTAQPTYRCDASDIRPLEVAEITDVYYEAGGVAQHGAIKPLSEVVITGRCFYTNEVRLYWGPNREHHEDGQVLSQDGDTELRVLFTAVEDGWFVSNHDSPCISVYNDGDCERGFTDFYPVAIDQRAYVEEVAQGLPIATTASLPGYSEFYRGTATWWTMDEPDAVIIVRDEAEYDFFSKLARIHTVTGVKTTVVSIRELSALGYGVRQGTGSADNIATANGIKDYIKDCYEDSDGTTRFFVLWGEATGSDCVPTMRVYDSFGYWDYIRDGLDVEFRYVTESDSFYSDFFFADLSVWDSNGNGVHNDDYRDSKIAYRADVGVSRIPFLQRTESYRYLEKVIHHLAYYDQDRIDSVLAISNEAGHGFDSAWWLETYTLDRLPSGWDITKLYEVNGNPSWGAEDLTLNREEEELENGHNLVIHDGHASEDYLTASRNGTAYDFPGSRAHELENLGHYPIMISGGCHAGGLGSGANAAGAELVSAPFGGAIAYLGNSSYGVGSDGTAQLLDGVIEEMTDWHNGRTFGYTRELLLTEAFQSGINHFKEEDGALVDELAWSDEEGLEWAPKSAVLIGDGLIPVHLWKHYDAPELEIERTRYRDEYGSGYIACFTFTLSDDYDDGVITLYSADTGRYYPVSTCGRGTAGLRLPESPDRIAVGYTSCSCLSAYKEVIYTDLVRAAPLGQSVLGAAGAASAADARSAPLQSGIAGIRVPPTATPAPARSGPAPIAAVQATATPVPAAKATAQPAPVLR